MSPPKIIIKLKPRTIYNFLQFLQIWTYFSPQLNNPPPHHPISHSKHDIFMTKKNKPNNQPNTWFNSLISGLVWNTTLTMTDRSDIKWICEYCTYENYPSALKCTMCRGHKPFVSEDIYRLHGNETDSKFSNTNLLGSASSVSETKTGRNKWSCEGCTFVNNSKDHLCVQCGTPQQDVAKNLHEQIQPLRISQHSDIAQSLSRSRNNSPPASVTNIENTRRTSQIKWICHVNILIFPIYIILIIYLCLWSWFSYVNC